MSISIISQMSDTLSLQHLIVTAFLEMDVVSRSDWIFFSVLFSCALFSRCVLPSSDVIHLTADFPPSTPTNRKCKISLTVSPSCYQMGVRAQHKGKSGESSGLQESCEASSPLRSDAQQNRASAAIVCRSHHSLPFTAILLLHGLSSTQFLFSEASLSLSA